MMNQFTRSELIFGKAAMERLAACRVAVFGLGGVGGHAAEALARGGIGALDLIDNDQYSLTNLNRQLFASHSTLGMYKVDAAKARILDICPDAAVVTHRCFFLPETAEQFDFTQYDYVVDAIDTVTAKLALAGKAAECGVPLISCMGTGNKLDPTALCVADIYETCGDALARVMRKELKKRGIKKLKVVYSRELPIEPVPELEAECMAELKAEGSSRRAVPGSTSFVPPAAGLIIAGEVIRDLADRRRI